MNSIRSLKKIANLVSSHGRDVLFFGYSIIIKDYSEHSVCLMDGTCVDIRERLVHDGRKYLVAREITAGMLRTSTMFLKTPKKLTASIMDTTKWEVDSGAITFESYVTTMIEEIFISGAAQMSPYNSAHILMLGLGGGYINSYLHHKFPNMDITVVELDPQMLEISKKWFGLKLDQRQRVFLMDGVHFVRNAVTEEPVSKPRRWGLCEQFEVQLEENVRGAQFSVEILNVGKRLRFVKYDGI
ncbi:hypothetical protein NECAME_14667 [Necator americanus]|uniref:PABS domain-containing protein n=1 Tax=Necator americanus TaxID=51031 RepID=W2SPE5_NECAM|nr:hypothetical protein NECAME_14667 [Necator americanus]ETN70572.1 hypothetical protein NECAME_14667 [Necator americanus]